MAGKRSTNKVTRQQLGINRTKDIKKPGRHIPRIVTGGRPGGPLTIRGPRPFQKRVTQTDSPGDTVPAGMSATLPEWYVFWWCTRRRHMTERQDFEFQSSLFGGRIDMGGLVMDFLFRGLFPPGLVVNVQGFNWHYLTTDQRAQNIITRQRLLNPGFTTVFVKEDDVLQRLDYTMSKALDGEQLFQDYV